MGKLSIRGVKERAKFAFQKTKNIFEKKAEESSGTKKTGFIPKAARLPGAATLAALGVMAGTHKAQAHHVVQNYVHNYGYEQVRPDVRVQVNPGVGGGYVNPNQGYYGGGSIPNPGVGYAVPEAYDYNAYGFGYNDYWYSNRPYVQWYNRQIPYDLARDLASLAGRTEGYYPGGGYGYVPMSNTITTEENPGSNLQARQPEFRVQDGNKQIRIVPQRRRIIDVEIGDLGRTRLSVGGTYRINLGRGNFITGVYTIGNDNRPYVIGQDGNCYGFHNNRIYQVPNGQWRVASNGTVVINIDINVGRTDRRDRDYEYEDLGRRNRTGRIERPRIETPSIERRRIEPNRGLYYVPNFGGQIPTECTLTFFDPHNRLHQTTETFQCDPIIENNYIVGTVIRNGHKTYGVDLRSNNTGVYEVRWNGQKWERTGAPVNNVIFGGFPTAQYDNGGNHRFNGF